MFNKFKENLQKKLEEYQKQMNTTGGNNQSNQVAGKSSNTLSLLIWSMTFAILINYFFFGKNFENQHIDTNQQSEQFIKQDYINFAEKDNFLIGNLNKNGITIDNVTLGKYKKNDNKSNVDMLSPIYSKDGIKNDTYSFIKLGFINSGTNKFFIDLPDDNSKWKLKSVKNNTYTFYIQNKNGFIFNRIFKFNNGYIFEIIDEIINPTNNTVELIPYKLIQQSIDIKNINKSSFSGITIITNNETEEIKYKTIEDKNIIRSSLNDKSVIGWTNNYFANTLISNFPVDVSIVYNKNLSRVINKDGKNQDIKNFQVKISDINPIIIKPNSKYSYTFQIFAGAKEIDMIEKYSKEISMPRFNTIVDYGSFFFIARPAANLLRFLNKYFNSMSIAIILFAIIMKFILLPLSIKQMKMTNKMKQMAPELKRIQTYYSDNKLQQQMQIAMLYKKHKINPFSLFTQLLIQIPIFLAMWRALIITIEMRQSKFIWINDLTLPDPLFILPILLGITMLIQIKLQNSGNSDNANPAAKATKYMPYIMTFMFAFLPSGLILYYIVGNILGIIQQEIANYYWNKNKCN